MRVAVALLTILATSLPAVAKDEPAPAPKGVVKVTRDLSRLAVGKYRMIQTWDSKGSETEEGTPGKIRPKKTLASSNRLTFAVEIAPATAPGTGKDLTVLAKRLEFRIGDGGENFAYDSDGPAAKQSDILVRQFHYLVGAKSRVGLEAFSDGEGFAGFDGAWDLFAKEQPDMERAAKSNRANFGDARLDRMFTQGVTVLFGADAGRAKGRTRELRVGEEFTTELEEPGIFMKPTVVEHACKVVSAAAGVVVVRVEWKINGFDPQTEGGGLSMRGGDIHGVSQMTFLAEGGLLTHLEETVERTDQAAPGSRAGVMQWTRQQTQKVTFSLVRE